MRVFFVLSAILVCILATVTLDRQPVPKVEFYHIVIVITAALMLLVQSNHFVMFFVALETVTVGFYILVSYFRTSAASLEAGLKYLILGALSSAILLFGIVLLYGVAGQPRAARRHGRADEFRRPARIPRGQSRQLPRQCRRRARARRRGLQDRRGAVPDLDPRRLPGRAHAGDGLSRRRLQGRRLRGAADAGAERLQPAAGGARPRALGHGGGDDPSRQSGRAHPAATSSA